MLTQTQKRERLRKHLMDNCTNADVQREFWQRVPLPKTRLIDAIIEFATEEELSELDEQAVEQC